MKKLFLYVFLCLLWSNFSYSLNPEEAKQACKDMGYEVGTEKFTDCSIKLVLEDSNSKKSDTFSTGSKKDCSHLKGNKLHKYLACKAGSDRYDDEEPVASKEVKKEDTFNEKFNSFADFFKQKKD